MRGDSLSDYNFSLPETLIAQHPPAQRGTSRLMVVDRARQTIAHHTFSDIVQFIPASDILVRNTTRVMRARLIGARPSGAPVEVLLLKPVTLSPGSDSTSHLYEAMVRPGNKLKPGRTVNIAPGFDVTIERITDRGTRIVALHTELPVHEAIERFGHVPLPPYITRSDSSVDADRYQTVYSDTIGSVAAPTAGLHFTEPLLADLTAKGVSIADVILHVGAGTFKPVDTERLEDHVMHEEWYHLPQSTADALNATRNVGGAIWAVGTTSVRTLESAIHQDGQFSDTSGETSIFIRPPYTWRAVDHLLTNFHLPKSTLLMLVAAFAGYDLTMTAYETAVAEQYRFFSYGDAMLII